MIENDLALMEVDWALQESFKRAVKLRSIVDWSREPSSTTREVERYQLEIAKMILYSLHKNKEKKEIK